MEIKIGSRGSQLALTQANLVSEALSAINIKSRIIIIKTSGDKITDKPLYDIGGKALFVKELEEALIEKHIDIAVHSMKDVPAYIPDKLTIAAYLKRESPLDTLISKNCSSIDALPNGARVGTCSVRRMAILKDLRPDLNIVPLRGNIDTRLQKFHEENFDAIILAAAGLVRMKRWDENCHIIPYSIMIPAVGQGAIGIEARKEDTFLLEILSKINHRETYEDMQMERGFVEEINGSCRTPLGCYLERRDGKIHAYFMLADEANLSSIKRSKAEYNISDKDRFYEFGRLGALQITS